MYAANHRRPSGQPRSPVQDTDQDSSSEDEDSSPLLTRDNVREGREGGRDGGRQGGREGGKELFLHHTDLVLPATHTCTCVCFPTAVQCKWTGRCYGNPYPQKSE